MYGLVKMAEEQEMRYPRDEDMSQTYHGLQAGTATGLTALLLGQALKRGTSPFKNPNLHMTGSILGSPGSITGGAAVGASLGSVREALTPIPVEKEAHEEVVDRLVKVAAADEEEEESKAIQYGRVGLNAGGYGGAVAGGLAGVGMNKADEIGHKIKSQLHHIEGKPAPKAPKGLWPVVGAVAGSAMGAVNAGMMGAGIGTLRDARDEKKKN